MSGCRMQGNRVLTQGNPGNPNNRRSGESRNPGNPPEKNGPATKRSGFRLSPERRFYNAVALCKMIFSTGLVFLARSFSGRGGFITRPGYGVRVCRIWLHPFRKLTWPWRGGRVCNPPLPVAMPIPVDRNRVNGWFDRLTMSGCRMQGNPSNRLSGESRNPGNPR